ncbi:MAG: site-2 protease family protein [Bernardetiaceae bacterium]|nr:site-2 protease family protein [Bernardetiaceae bacterium]
MTNTKRSKTYALHLSLFILTLIATTFAGAEWMHGEGAFIVFPEGEYGLKWGSLGWSEFWKGLHYSLPFLGILTFHEFGHYFAARRYKMDVSLPFYMPMWLGFLGMPGTIGTIGAFIKIKSPFRSKAALFDVGVAGPIAGFVVALALLFYGFSNLPEPEHIFEIHPSYAQYGMDYEKHVYGGDDDMKIALGTSLLFEFFKTYVADPARLPNDFEIMHYPYLFAGFLALFFTALNMMPIGQLDGGHVIYAMFGSRKSRKISLFAFVVFVSYAGLGLFDLRGDIVWDELLLWAVIYFFFLYFVMLKPMGDRKGAIFMASLVFSFQFLMTLLFPEVTGYTGWLVFAFLLGRVLGVYHPPVFNMKPLSKGRMIIAWLSLIMFILCFSPKPFIIS